MVKKTEESLQTTFERFLMSCWSARSNLVFFFLKKNLTSNGPKPIRVLTRTICSFSDKRLPIGFLVCDFQLI